MDFFQQSLILHKKSTGKIQTICKIPLETQDDLATAYSPWVAAPCQEIANNPEKVYDYTLKANTIAVISDGSAVLWLGNIGPQASLPVMEWKCVLFQKFAHINAFPIVLDTQDTQEIIETIVRIAPTFWGINLEDISAPRCFQIEEELKKRLDIPVMHDDQHGTAIVVLAGLINALRVTKKEKKEVKIIVNGLWAAGTAIIKLLVLYGFSDIIVCDSKGIISENRQDLNTEKKEILTLTGMKNISGTLADAVQNTDIFIGVSAPGVLTPEMIASMNPHPIIFALANPTPEIMPEQAYTAWAKIVATGRSDCPNQLNNVLVFPWIFAWALKNKVTKITDVMKIRAAEKLANCVTHPTSEKIIPHPFDPWVVDAVSQAIYE